MLMLKIVGFRTYILGLVLSPLFGIEEGGAKRPFGNKRMTIAPEICLIVATSLENEEC